MFQHKIIAVFIFGFLISLLWRISNIKNDKVNFLSNKKIYYDDIDDVSNKVLEIDISVIVMESFLGSLFAVFISYLLIIMGLFHLTDSTKIPYDFVISFFSIPGYNIFIRLRVLINDFITKYLPKKLTEF